MIVKHSNRGRSVYTLISTKRVSSVCSLGRHSNGKEIPFRARPRPTPPSTFLFLPTLFSFQRSRRTNHRRIALRPSLQSIQQTLRNGLHPEAQKQADQLNPLGKPRNQTVSSTAKQTSLPGRLVRPTAPRPSSMSGL